MVPRVVPERQHRVDSGVLLMLEPVVAGVQQLGRPMSTREVQADLNARLVATGRTPLTSNALRTLLKALSVTAPHRAGDPTWREPKLQAFDIGTAMQTEAKAWAPIGYRGEVPVRARSHADAVRRAALHTTTALGRPATRVEARRWLEVVQTLVERADAPSAVTEQALEVELLKADNLATYFWNATRKDGEWMAKHGCAPGRLHQVTTPFSCIGGSAVRYSVGDAPQAALAACVVEDAAIMYRFADELDSILALEG